MLIQNLLIEFQIYGTTLYDIKNANFYLRIDYSRLASDQAASKIQSKWVDVYLRGFEA